MYSFFSAEHISMNAIISTFVVYWTKVIMFAVFLDLEKVFDTVHHDILCEKLKFYGLSGNINKLI